MHKLPELDVFECSLDGMHLIEASAGTGKTWNLCGLYLRLLVEQRRTVQDILVVTFTNAATAELRERIRSRLAEIDLALASDVGDQGDPFVPRLLHTWFGSGRLNTEEARQRIRLALESFDEAAIFTIHGFCQRALAETPFAAAQPFRFELQADDGELGRQVAADFWRKEVIHADLSDEFAAHLLQQGCSPDWLLNQLRRRLRKPLARLLWPAFPSPDENLGPALHRLFDEARNLWVEQEEILLDILTQAIHHLNATTYKAASIGQAFEQWQSYFLMGEPLAPLQSKQRLLTAGQLANKTKKAGKTPEHPFLDLAGQLVQAHETLCHAMELQRLRLLQKWLEQAPADLARRKLQLRALAFDDLLNNLHRALTGGDYPWLAHTLRQRFPCALVDEFQDTDPVQYAIFRHIYVSSEPPAPLFLVGDPKQAIYSFRGADLHTYLGARADARHAHTLSANQRSSGLLIQACNALFLAHGAAFALPGLSYQQVCLGGKPRHKFFDGDDPHDGLQLWQLPEAIPRRQATALAASVTAGEIARLLNAGQVGEVCVNDRPIKASDIAVIVRSHNQGRLIKSALAQRGIGSVELSQDSIYASVQAEELERILLAVADPAHTGLLRGALATELIGLDAPALAALDNAEAGLAQWVERFQDYRGLWQRHGFAYFFRSLLVELNVAARLLVLPEGERKLTNWLHLGELLQSQAEHHQGLDTLPRWLSEQRQSDGRDETAQLRLETDENLVQIITIHKSKGLEYPIVFCPFLWQGESGNRGNRNEGLEYHLGDQAIIDFSLDDTQRLRGEAARAEEDAAEQLRLIYVAMTRAIHRCYLVVGAYLSRAGKWGSYKESARAPLNWLVTGGNIDFSQWLAGETPPEQINTAWRTLAMGSNGCIKLAAIAQADENPRLIVTDQPHQLSARKPQKLPGESWRLASFTALNRWSDSETSPVDHDALPLAPSRNLVDTLPATDMLRFPRGGQAGTCLHRAFELADYADSGSWQNAVAASLQECPPGGEESSESLSNIILQGLQDVLATPLMQGFCLAQLPRQKRLNELEFNFSAEHLAAHPLNRLLQAQGYPQLRLWFPAFKGYLKGFIDLVFQHENRFYVLDWKSNHLGYSQQDYGPHSVNAAMSEHGYHLQYLIYSLALHRFLEHRLANYDFQTHFGGCLYLFIRGVRPKWRNADGSPSGVYFHRPAKECIRELDRLVGRPESTCPA